MRGVVISERPGRRSSMTFGSMSPALSTRRRKGDAIVEGGEVQGARYVRRASIVVGDASSLRGCGDDIAVLIADSREEVLRVRL